MSGRLRTCWSHLLLLALIAVGIGFPNAQAELPVLAIQAVYPPVLSAGTQSSLQITAGRFVQDVEELLFSHPGITATLNSAPNLPFDEVPQKAFGSFQVHVAADVPEGMYEVWAMGRYGISNPRTLAVVHRPVELLPSDTEGMTSPLLPGTVYVGRMRANASSRFRLPVASPNPRIAVAAAAFESLALPVLVASDASGKLLARKRAFGSDPFVLEPHDYRERDSNEDGFCSIYDFLHRGGDPFAFAIMIDPSQHEPLFQPSPFLSPAAVAAQGLVPWPSVAGVSEGDTAALRMGTPPWDTHVEISGKQGRRSIEFPPAEGIAYECEVFSQAIGQSTDIRAVVERIPSPADPKNAPKLVLVAEDGPVSGSKAVRLGSSDPLFTIPSDSLPDTVRITLIDLNRITSDRPPSNVRLRVGPPIPRFHAIAHWVPDTNNTAQARTTGAALPRGGQIALHFSIRRAGGFQGPVAIAIEGLPPGITATPAIVAANQTETESILYADESVGAWRGTVTSTARGRIDGQDVSVPVQPVVISFDATSERGLPHARMSSQLWLRVLEQDVAPIQIRAGDGQILEIAQGSGVPIPVRAIRRAGGEAKCILRPQNVPPKVSFGDVELAPNVGEANPEFKVAADAPPGEYCIWFQTEMTVQQSLHSESHSRAVGYRDRLQSRFADPSWNGDRPGLEKAIADSTARIDALAKEVAPRDFPTFFSSASFRVRIVPTPTDVK